MQWSTVIMDRFVLHTIPLAAEAASAAVPPFQSCVSLIFYSHIRPVVTIVFTNLVDDYFVCNLLNFDAV